MLSDLVRILNFVEGRRKVKVVVTVSVVVDSQPFDELVLLLEMI